MKAQWLEVDVEGLRKTLTRKGKTWALFELIQNSWDAEAQTVKVTLTRPKDGTSTLTCTDDAPGGFADLSHAHTLYAESDKKGAATKRGRFSAGDKYVLALMRSATVSSTTGQVIFQSNGQRKMGSKCTEVGSEFKGVLTLTEADYDDIMSKVVNIIPPIPTFINGTEVIPRNPLHAFKTSLPTELADDAGILRSRTRETNVILYTVKDGEKPTLYEMGLPVVEIDCKWHVNIGQKVPLNLERDNVNPSYLRALFSAIVNEKGADLSDDEAAAAWITTALEHTKTKPEAIKTIVIKRFGDGAVRRDYKDKGSNRECQSRDLKVVERGAFPKAVWDNINKHDILPKAGDVCPTDRTELVPTHFFTRDEWTAQMLAYESFLIKMAPLLIDHAITVEYIEDDTIDFRGCTRWKKGSFIMEINLAYHDVSDWQGNVFLMIHEFAHHKVQNNDHLWRKFYDNMNLVSAKLVKLAVTNPELFPSMGGSDASEAIIQLMEMRFEGLGQERLGGKEEVEQTDDEAIAV